MAHGDHSEASQLAHFKHLAVDVPRVLRRREPVAQVVRAFVICGRVDGPVLNEPDPFEQCRER